MFLTTNTCGIQVLNPQQDPENLDHQRHRRKGKS